MCDYLDVATFESFDQRFQLSLHSCIEFLEDKTCACPHPHGTQCGRSPQHHSICAKDHLDRRPDGHSQARSRLNETAGQADVENLPAEELRAVAHEHFGVTIYGVARMAPAIRSSRPYGLGFRALPLDTKLVFVEHP